MKAVITGAGSFVAYHLARKLLEDNYEIVGIDIQNNKNIEELLSFSNFSFHKEDITENNKISKICKNVDVIYHLAAISSERLCREDPILSVKVNILGTLKMLDVAYKENSLFVFSSSGSVYPDKDKAKEEEEANFTDRFYGISKFLAEKYCNLYHKNFNVNYVILRFSRIYGPRMMRNPIYDMSLGLTKNHPIKLYESLSSRYDFVFVLDVVRAFCMASQNNWKNKTLNISSQQSVELSKVYETMANLHGIKQDIEVINDKKGIDVLSNAHAKTLGWKPEYSLEQGLSLTLGYFKSLL